MDAETHAFVKERFTAVLGTAASETPVQVAAIHYVLDDYNSSIIFKSRATSDHVLSLAIDSHAALAIYRHESTYSRKAGVQIRGVIERIVDPGEMARCVDLYSTAFPGARERFDPLEVLVRPDAPSTLFKFVPEQYKFINDWSGRYDKEYQLW
jgi:uncharacterized protein YhbP (UPF0306 family)